MTISAVCTVYAKPRIRGIAVVQCVDGFRRTTRPSPVAQCSLRLARKQACRASRVRDCVHCSGRVDRGLILEPSERLAQQDGDAGSAGGQRADGLVGDRSPADPSIEAGTDDVDALADDAEGFAIGIKAEGGAGILTGGCLAEKRSCPIAGQGAAIGRGHKGQATQGKESPSFPGNGAVPHDLAALCVPPQPLGSPRQAEPDDLGGRARGCLDQERGIAGVDAEANRRFSRRIENLKLPAPVVIAANPPGPITKSSIGNRSSCFQTQRPEGVRRPIRSRS